MRSGDRSSGTSASSTLSPHPIFLSSVLRWAVKERALVCGFASVRELSFATRVPRQSLHPIWMGVSKNVSLDMLGILAKTLDANLGDWFHWDGEILRWRIPEATEAKGFTLSDLAGRLRSCRKALGLCGTRRRKSSLSKL